MWTTKRPIGGLLRIATARAPRYPGQIARFGEKQQFRFPTKRKTPRPVYKDQGSSWAGPNKKPIVDNAHERATARSEQLLQSKPLGRRWLQEDFHLARSTLNYFRTQRNSNQRTVHGALNLLERMLHEVHHQEQMYRSDWCTFTYVEPLLLNWKQSWREEWDREQLVHEPMELLEQVQGMLFPESFDPDNRTVETILCGMIEVAHKFDKPVLGEEMLAATKRVSLAMCNHVVNAWIISEKWNDEDVVGVKAFVHTMVERYNMVPDAETYAALRAFLGDAVAAETIESALADLPSSQQIEALATMGLIELAQEKMNVSNEIDPGVIQNSLRAILMACEDDDEKALSHYNRSVHLLDDESNDLVLGSLLDLYVERGLMEAAKKVIELFRLQKPYEGLVTILAKHDEVDKALSVVKAHPHPAVVEAAVRGFSEHPDLLLRILDTLKHSNKLPHVKNILYWLHIVLENLATSPQSGKKAYDLVLRVSDMTKPTDVLYKLAIEACLFSGLLFEANELAHRVHSFADKDTRLVRGWLERGTRQAAAQTAAMLARLNTPSMLAYNVYMYAVIMSAHPETGGQIEEILQEARGQKLKPDDVSFELAIDFLSQSTPKDVARAETIFHTLGRPKREYYDFIIAGHIRLRNARGARKMIFKQVEDFVNFKDSSLLPNLDFVYSTTRIFIKSNEIGKAHHFVEDMTDLWLADYIPRGPNKGTIKILMDAWGMSDDPGKEVYLRDIVNLFADVYEKQDEGNTVKVAAEPDLPFEPAGNLPSPPGTPEELNYYDMEGLSSDDGSDSEGGPQSDSGSQSDSASDFDNDAPLFVHEERNPKTDTSIINFDRSDEESDNEGDIDFDALFATHFEHENGENKDKR